MDEYTQLRCRQEGYLANLTKIPFSRSKVMLEPEQKKQWRTGWRKAEKGRKMWNLSMGEKVSLTRRAYEKNKHKRNADND